jgi:hypothetical protein
MGIMVPHSHRASTQYRGDRHHSSGQGAGDNELRSPALVRLTFHTSRNVETTAYTRDTALKSSGGGKRGTLLLCRTYFRDVRRYRTSGLSCGATNRRVDIGFGGHWGLGFSPDRARDPKPRTGHARGGTCRNIMTEFGCTSGKLPLRSKALTRCVTRYSLQSNCTRVGTGEPNLRGFRVTCQRPAASEALRCARK